MKEALDQIATRWRWISGIFPTEAHSCRDFFSGEQRARAGARERYSDTRFCKVSRLNEKLDCLKQVHLTRALGQRRSGTGFMSRMWNVNWLKTSGETLTSSGWARPPGLARWWRRH